MDLVEKTIKKQVVFEGKILRVRQDEASLPDGKPCTREVVEHPGAVCVLCIKEGKAFFVRQFRYAIGEESLELPAGKLDRGEAPKDAALRELEEETGVKASRADLLFAMYPSPGYTNEVIYVFSAEVKEEAGSHPDEGEFLCVERIPIEKAYTMIEDGRIKDAKTIAALLFFKAHDRT